jgi:hypothetical protein
VSRACDRVPLLYSRNLDQLGMMIPAPPGETISPTLLAVAAPTISAFVGSTLG